MHVNQLEYFAATMESGSFFAAAKKVYLTPQAIEKAIHKLEQELGGPLFEPAGRSYQPTPLGKSLYGPALEAIADIHRLHDIARTRMPSEPECGEATVALAVAPHRCAWLTPASFEPFRREHPGIRLTVKCNSSGICLSAVRSGIADAAVAIGPVNDCDLRTRRLFSFPLKVALSPSHPLASGPQGRLTLRELARCPIAAPIDTDSCHRVIKRAFDEAGALPRFVDVPFGEEQRFLDCGGAIFVASKTHLDPVAPESVAMGLVDRERIVLPVCFAERLGDQNPSLTHLSSYLARLGEKARRPPSQSESGSAKPERYFG